MTARLTHETFTRSDAVLLADGRLPEDLEARHLELGAYPLSSQFSDALFRSEADAFVLSIQADVTTGLMRSKKDAYLFYPSETSLWSADDRTWLRSEFTYVEP